MTPPGTRLRALAARLLGATTMERLVDPLIADLQAEYEEASRQGLRWRKYRIWIAGHLAFLTMLLAHGGGRIAAAVARRVEALRPRNTVFADARGLSLDFRVAVRLLRKHIGLTVVSTAAMAFAIWTAMVAFEFFTQIVRPTLPLESGDRIVGIVMSDTAKGSQATPTLHDFIGWKDTLRSVQDLSAFRDRDLNVIVGDEPAEAVAVAEISAAAFRVVETRPVLGRPLVDADEKTGSASVVVIGHDVWQSRFGSDPGVIGRELRLGNVHHTVVGVMPEGFRFPLAHSFWVPLKLEGLNNGPQRSPTLRVFGRLAPGATLDTAQPELGVLGAAAAARFPDTHEHKKPRVVPYIHSVFTMFSASTTAGLISVNLLVVSLLVLVCGNVALLMFARAATRENEILVRTALGASRGRIVGQLFVEALVLATVAAAVALTAARAGWRWVFTVMTGNMFEHRDLPFWLHPTLSPESVLYGVLLTLIAAAIAGLVPGLKVTGGMATRLRQASAGGGGLRFGGMWTALMVVQVAVMAVVPFFLVVILGESASTISATSAGLATEQYLSASIAMDRNRIPGGSGATFSDRLAASTQELERRLEAEPGIAGVTFADLLPLMDHPARRIDVDEGGAAPVSETFGYRRVSSAWVAVDFFEVLGAPALSGRGFHSGDVLPAARTVVVNESFVRLVLGGNNPIGRRVRYTDLEQRSGASGGNASWYQIVGVVRDMGIRPASGDPKRARIYHPLVPGRAYPVRMAVHTKGDPLLFASRMRSIATEVDPTLQLHEVIRLDEVTAPDVRLFKLLFWVLLALTSIVLVLSLSGIYAVLSFIAAQRTREVGIRVALGGRPRHVAAALFRRPLAQIGLGIVLGLAGAVALSGGKGVGVIGLYGCVIIAISSVATAGPIRRALRIQPVDALRAE